MKVTVVASFESPSGVYLLCDKVAQEIKTWASPQAARRWFIKYYSELWRTRGQNTARLHHEKLKFKIHVIPEKNIDDDSFENAVVKAPRLLDEKLLPDEHVREPVQGPAEAVVGLMCQGERARTWRLSGTEPIFPRFC